MSGEEEHVFHSNVLPPTAEWIFVCPEAGAAHSSKIMVPVYQTRLRHIPDGSDSSELRPSSVAVVECSQDEDNITGSTGQGQDRGAREEEEKDKQFGKWCQHEKL